MSKTQLNNYLKTYRKNSGLLQREVAYLLGCGSSSKISLYERSNSMPMLETVFGCEVLFGASAQDLFMGCRGRVQRRVMRRVRELLKRLNKQTRDPQLVRKVEFLQALAFGGSEELKYEQIQNK